MSNNPKVSVLMAVSGNLTYLQGLTYLRGSIESILNQTFKDFELIIVTERDASVETDLIIACYDDRRIRHIQNPAPPGIVGSLNAGLQVARGEYVARMDADDVCSVERFERQVRFLDERQDVGIVGTSFNIIDGDGVIVSSHSRPSEVALTKWRLLFGYTVVQPSVMMRTNMLRKLGGYSSRFLHVEDYDLWMRASRITGIVNLPDLLLGWRTHPPGGVSRMQFLEARLNSAVEISKEAMEDLLSCEIATETVKALTVDSRGNEWESAKVLHRLCMKYIDMENLSRKEEIDVRSDAAKRMNVPLLRSIKHHPLLALRICLLIARTRCRMLPRILAFNLKRTWIPWIQRIIKNGLA